MILNTTITLTESNGPGQSRLTAPGLYLDYTMLFRYTTLGSLVLLSFCLSVISLKGQIAMNTQPLHTPLAKGSIEGVAKDAQSGEALAFSTVQVLEAPYHVISDDAGRFTIKDLPVGRYHLLVTYMGYQDLRIENIEVVATQTQWVEAKLLASSREVGEVVVTASLRSQAINLAPASIGIISNSQIRAQNISSFDQAFDQMPGVVVTRSSGSNVQAFSIRGASEVAGGGVGNRVLLLIDGRPALSPESGGALWNLVPLGSIERIEVVRGAYSSLYGSSAMGGVVNVITKKPGDKPQTRLQLDYGAYGPAPQSTGYRRYNDFRTIALNHSNRKGRFSYLVDGNWRADDGHREKSDFDQYNFYGKTIWELSKTRQITFSANFNHIYNSTPATWLSFRQAYSVADFRKDDFQDRSEFNADLFYQARPTEKVKYTTRFYHYRNHSLFTFDDDPGNDSTNVNIGKQIVERSNIKTSRLGNVTQIDLFDRKGHYIIVGTDSKWDDTEGTPDTFLYGRHQAVSVGAYIQDEISIGDKCTVTAGIRYDYFGIVNQTNESNISPKLAAIYRLKPNFSLRALLAQAFRDPPIAERFIKFEQGGGLRFMPNPGLRPERLVISSELGGKFNPTPNATIDFCLFYNRYNDLISFQQLSDPLEPLLYKVVNLSEAIMQGFELSYHYQWRNWLNANLSYTFLDARDASPNRVNDALAYKPRHTFGGSVSAQCGKFMFNVNGRYRSKIEEVFIYPGSEPDAALITNTKISYNLNKRSSCYFAINNLNNEQYEELERYRMPGRHFAAGLDFHF